MSLLSPSLSPPPEASTALIVAHHQLILSVPELHVSGIVQFVFFGVWLLSLHTRSWKLTHIVTCIRSLVPFTVASDSSAWTYHNSFIHSPFDGHGSSFAINKTPMNILIQVHFGGTYFISLHKRFRVEFLDPKVGIG